MSEQITIPSDIEIAQAAPLRPISEVAAELGLRADDLDTYGKYKAKIPLEIARRPVKGRLVLVTAVNPTPAGEGKSTVTVGLTQALRKLGQNAMLCMREPSLGPVFGVKGGAAGGGYSQLLPMQDINLHFTGDFHAISSAHALLSAMVDNHMHWGNDLNINPKRISWHRSIDMNDRALRDVVIGIGKGNGVAREEKFVIIPASEIMAIVALSTSYRDLEDRLARIIVGQTHGKSRKPVRAGELKAAGAMALLLADAIRPNLVQTLEGGPAFVHAGPFGNIAHGCNSILATRSALALADLVVTEAGFGSDLGAEKFFDIKCRFGGLNPEAAVLVATVRSLKMQGGANKKVLTTEDLGALERGLPNLEKHIDNVRQFGVPVVVALNRVSSDTDAELKMVMDFVEKLGAPIALTEVWARGGAGGEALAKKLLQLLDKKGAEYRPLYPTELPIKEKIETIVRKVYGGDGVEYAPEASRAIEYLESVGLGQTPVCIAKTQYSLTDDPTVLGRPSGFHITINDVWPAAGAGFVVARAGEIMTMPGLGKEPSAEKIGMLESGEVVGLF
jgi:formate--tetrahydrofolate ligase